MDTTDFTQNQIEHLKESAREQVKVATALKIMTSTEGWSILLSTFEDMKQQQLDQLSKQRPGDDKAILAAHAVWAATVHTLNEIVEAVNHQIILGEESRQFLDAEEHRSEEDNDWP